MASEKLLNYIHIIKGLRGSKAFRSVWVGGATSRTSAVQAAKPGRYEGEIDEDVGPHPLFLVLDFQEAVFGRDTDNGIVGPMTASALEMD